MGVGLDENPSQRPMAAPPPTPLRAPQSQTCRGAPPLQGALGLAGRGHQIKESLPTLAHPEQHPSASAVAEASPRPSPEGQTDQAGGPSSPGLVRPPGAKVIPTPTPDSSGPFPAPALRLATDTPGKPQGRWFCGLSDPPPPSQQESCPHRVPRPAFRWSPSPVCPSCVARKISELGASLLPCPPSLPALGPNPLPPAHPALLPLTGKDPQRSLDNCPHPLPGGPSWPDGMDPTQNHN